MSRLRLVFMGTPEIAVPVLDALIGAGHNIACVYSQPPRPAGRGQHETPCAAHAFAAKRGIEVRCPANLKGRETQRDFAALDADAAVVIAYGLILPPKILSEPRLGCINVHASLLPRWRGAAPIQRAIMEGDGETGVTIMQMDAGLDTGPTLLSGATPISPDTTAQSLHDTLAALGARLINEALDGIAAGTLHPVPQPEDGANYAKKLTREEARLDWNLPAAQLERHVRALNPWPGTWFEHDGDRIRVLAAECIPDGGGVAPGTALDDVLTVACAGGALRLTRLQRPGRAALPAAKWLHGYTLPQGTKLA
jgi:methionyl-tRNA formyltransferase